jgi:hypothetical protein
MPRLHVWLVQKLVESGLALGPCSCGLAVDQYDEYYTLIQFPLVQKTRGPVH